MTRIVLHIGTHKTGTTSLQKSLFANRKILEKNGIWYPDYSIINKKPHYAHLGIFNAFSDAHPNLERKDAENFFDKINKGAAKYDTVILSAEPIYRHADVQGHSHPFTRATKEQYWEGRRQYIKRIAQFFDPHNTQIVVTFREQASYAESLYHEHIMATKYKKKFDAFLKEFWFHFVYLQQAEMWKSIFPNFLALRFEDLIYGGTLLKNFGRIIQLDLSSLHETKRENNSLYQELTIIKRELNKSKYTDQENYEKATIFNKLLGNTQKNKNSLRAEITHFAQTSFIQELSRNIPRSLFANMNELEAYRATFEDDNAALNRIFFDNKSVAFFKKSYENVQFGDELNPGFLLEMMRRIPK